MTNTVTKQSLWVFDIVYEADILFMSLHVNCNKEKLKKKKKKAHDIRYRSKKKKKRNLGRGRRDLSLVSGIERLLISVVLYSLYRLGALSMTDY